MVISQVSEIPLPDDTRCECIHVTQSNQSKQMYDNYCWAQIITFYLYKDKF